MPVLFIANKTMKKILSIIIGLVVGPTLGLALAMSDREQKAFALNPWTEIVAAAESHSWKDVFGTINPGKVITGRFGKRRGSGLKTRSGQIIFTPVRI